MLLVNMFRFKFVFPRSTRMEITKCETNFTENRLVGNNDIDEQKRPNEATLVCASAA